MEEILRNPLAMLKVIHRLGLFLHDLNSSPPDFDLVSGQTHLHLTTHRPFQVFSITTDLGDLLNLELNLPFLTTLRNEFGINSFPLSQDLADAADGILRMQFTYNLKASDVSRQISNASKS